MVSNYTQQQTSADEQLEQLRRYVLRWRRIAMWAGIVATVVLYLLLVYLIYLTVQDGPLQLWFDRLREYGVTAIFPPIVGLLGVQFAIRFLAVSGATRRFRQIFKETYVLSLLEETGLFKNLRYEAHRGFSATEIYDAGLLDTGERHLYHCEDSLTGNYRGVGFRLSDVLTQHTVRSGKSTRVETLFRGQVIQFETFDSHKTSFGHLQILAKDWLHKREWVAPYRILTESEAFNSHYDLYAADEHNAFYLLTPQRIEAIERFRQKAGVPVSLVFVGRTLYLAVETDRDLFDYDISLPVEQQKQQVLYDAALVQLAGDILLANTVS